MHLRKGLAMAGMGLCVAMALRAGGDELSQWSTIDALLRGHYEGVVTLGEARAAGDLGLGTLEALDGELLILDGKAYQIDSRGQVREPADDARLPFVAVTRFETDVEFTVPAGVDMAELQRRVEAARVSPNYVYAVRISGNFTSVRTRSVARQDKPWRPLSEVVRTQSVFDFAATRGELAGFVCPGWTRGLNVPGHHYHFLTGDHSGGGHVLGLVTGDDVRVRMDLTPDFSMRLPVSAEFGAIDLQGDRSAELHAVESERR